MKKIVIGITGASGSIYAKRMIEVLLESDDFYIHVICTDNGRKVMNYELDIDVVEWIEALSKEHSNIVLEKNDNLFSSVASGSYKYDYMVVLPCSMGTLAEISHGISKNLLTRAADVALKEDRKLVIVPRETPLSSLHLENMLRLSKLGVKIVPAMPGFYHKPLTLEEIIDFVIGKILDLLSIENDLFKKWGN